MVRVVFGLVVGIVVIAITLVSVFTTLIVPRATASRMLRTIGITVARLVIAAMKKVPTYNGKDRLMAGVGPFTMILLFVTWLALLVVGYGLVTWYAAGTTLGHAFGIAGSSVFTLGVVTGRRPATETLEFVTAGTGLLVIALEIAYLPALYSAFSLRETEVTLLATRAGTPAWGPEVLARHHWFRTTSELPDLYRTWERWAAAVSESHTNYPVLMWFRSPVPWRSWLTGLTAMLDTAALHDALTPGAAPRQARNFIQMGVNCLRQLAGALHIPYDPDPLPTGSIRLTYDEYMIGIERLREVEFPFERQPEEAWRHFVGWRINYEQIVDELTRRLMPPPAPWFLSRPMLGPVQWPMVIDRTPDDPQQGVAPHPPRTAQQLVDLTAPAEPWRPRLRRRS